MTLRPLLAYLPWHGREVAMRTLWPIGIFLLVGGLPIIGVSQTDGFDLGSGAVQEFARRNYTGTAPLVIILGSIVVMSRTVSFDRERQYVRFLFAHPVVPWQFYLQRYLVGAIGFAGIYSVVPALYSWMYTPVPVLGTLLAVLLISSLFGALSTLAAAITQRDGGVTIIAFLASTVLQVFAENEILPRWMEVIANVLPPIKKAGDVMEALIEQNPVPTEHLPLIVGYTLGMLLLALLIIRRAPLVR